MGKRNRDQERERDREEIHTEMETLRDEDGEGWRERAPER